jgi:hypothetical protein
MGSNRGPTKRIKTLDPGADAPGFLFGGIPAQDPVLDRRPAQIPMRRGARLIDQRVIGSLTNHEILVYLPVRCCSPGRD